jgi:hypothetical protein
VPDVSRTAVGVYEAATVNAAESLVTLLAPALLTITLN